MNREDGGRNRLFSDLAEIFGNPSVVLARELTKVYEKLRRGKVSEISPTIPREGVKGECVVLVDLRNGKDEVGEVKTGKPGDRMKKKMLQTAEILYGSSESDAIFTTPRNLWCPNPVFFIRIGEKSFLFLNDLEIDRGRKEAKVDEVLSISEWQKKVKKKNKKQASDVRAWLIFF